MSSLQTPVVAPSDAVADPGGARSGDPAGRPRSRGAWIGAAGVALLALAAFLVLLVDLDARPPLELVWQTGRMVAATLVVVLVPGLPLARRYAPRSLAPWWPVLALPLGFAAAMVGLGALGLTGLRPRPATLAFLVVALALGAWSLRRPAAGRIDVPGTVAILAGAAGVALLALLPVAVKQSLTVFGPNPDAHQVIGTVLYLQDAYPFGTHVQTALDRVPEAWAGRVPIFQVLGSATEVGLTGPVQMFAPFVAVLTATAAAGAGAFAAAAFRLPGWAAGLVALAVGASAATLHVALHPYYNQLWGMVLMAWALAFAWPWLRDVDARAGILTGVLSVLALVAYPNTLPYVVAVVLVLAVAAGRRPRVPSGLWARLRRVWPLLVAAAVVLGASLVWAIAKVAGIASQFVDGSKTFWQGDVREFPLHGAAYGLPGDSVLVPIAVAVVAVLAVARTRIRSGVALAVLAVLVIAVDAILRGRDTAGYVDYKHVSFSALVLLPLALGGALAAVRAGWLRFRGPESPAGDAASAAPTADAPTTVRWASPLAPGRLVLPAAVLGAVVLLAWAVPAARETRDEVEGTPINLTAELQQTEAWSDALPAGSSVLLDLPASGTQLWETLLFGARHRLASTDPVASTTTYAVAPYGERATYVLGLVGDLATGAPVPPPRWSVGRPLFRNRQFAVWRMRLPANAARLVPETASLRLVRPGGAPNGATNRDDQGGGTRTPSTFTPSFFLDPQVQQALRDQAARAAAAK